MTRALPLLRRTCGSGATPAVLLMLLAALCLREAALVPLTDQARYAAYVVGWIVLPGTLLWRLVERRRRPLVEDLALGALAGFVLEFPVYLLALAAGHPRWYLAWPVVALGARLVIALARGRRPGPPRDPRPRWGPGWSWSVSALIGYVLLWWTHHVWGPSPSAGPATLAPYVDQPYHLSVIASLRRDFPADVLFVEDTRLDYHFLSHLHLAAGSWVSGVEPAVLLAALALPVAVVAALVALASIGSRFSGKAWVGPVALAGVLVVPADFSGGTDGATAGFLDLHLNTSPSAAFVNVGLLLGLVLVVGLLRDEFGTGRRGLPAWALTGLTFLAMCGQKVTSLPVVFAGLVLAAVVASLTGQRRTARITWGLTGSALAAFLLARELFFGRSAHGLAWDPLGHLEVRGRAYPGILGADGQLSAGVAALVLVSYLAWITLGAGALMLLRRGGWRDPGHAFLVGVCAAGFGATLAFHQVGFSEGYFVIVVQAPLLLAGALGIARVTAGAHGLGRRPVRAAVWCLALGAGAGMLLVGLVPHPAAGSPAVQATWIFVLPILAVLVLAAVTALVAVRVLRRDGTGRPGTAAVLVLVLAGLGLAPTLRTLPDLIRDPAPAARATTPGLIGPGGIRAARYLRTHAGTDDVVATNAHCARPARGTDACRPLNFWMAGYAERQFLVEGWGFVSRTSAGYDAPPEEDVVAGPFWDPALLAENDAALTDPGPAATTRLRERYGVRWLLVDRRMPVDLVGLRTVARPVFRSGVYTVFRLTPPAGRDRAR